MPAPSEGLDPDTALGNEPATGPHNIHTCMRCGEQWDARQPAPSEGLPERLHKRYAGALCISDLDDLHDWAACDSKAQWEADAAALAR